MELQITVRIDVTPKVVVLHLAIHALPKKHIKSLGVPSQKTSFEQIVDSKLGEVK